MTVTKMVIDKNKDMENDRKEKDMENDRIEELREELCKQIPEGEFAEIQKAKGEN